MHKFISYEKLSKKKKKEIDQLKREDWGSINPIIRIKESKKNYSRKIKYKKGNFCEDT